GWRHLHGAGRHVRADGSGAGGTSGWRGHGVGGSPDLRGAASQERRMSIVARGVSVRYPGSAAVAVDRVSLSLDPGELLVVAGPNGSGKSSLFRALLGMLPLEHGEVRIDDRELGGWRRSELARVVGALTQRE